MVRQQTLTLPVVVQFDQARPEYNVDTLYLMTVPTPSLCHSLKDKPPRGEWWTVIIFFTD